MSSVLKYADKLNLSLSQILQCIKQISHNAPFGNINGALWDTERVNCGTGALWDLCQRSIIPNV